MTDTRIKPQKAITLDEEVWDWIDMQANSRRLSRSGTINQLMYQHMDREHEEGMAKG